MIMFVHASERIFNPDRYTYLRKVGGQACLGQRWSPFEAKKRCESHTSRGSIPYLLSVRGRKKTKSCSIFTSFKKNSLHSTYSRNRQENYVSYR